MDNILEKPEVATEEKPTMTDPMKKDKTPSPEKGGDAKRPVIKSISIDKLKAFEEHPFQLYEDERLQKLADSIRDTGLQNPITVRPLDGGQYQILSGHNRVAAVKLLGEKVINAIVKDGLSDEMAERIVVESNLNQQSFGDWKYSQQIKVIKIYDKYLQDNSQQGKRNDLTDNPEGTQTSDHDEHKSVKKEKRPKSRDKISKQLGISSSVFVRYRSIAKLDDKSLDIICNMLDEKRLGFMSAFRLSQLKSDVLSSVLDLMANIPNTNFRGPNVKLLCESIVNPDGAELKAEDMKNILLPDATVSQ